MNLYVCLSPTFKLFRTRVYLIKTCFSSSFSVCSHIHVMRMNFIGDHVVQYLMVNNLHQDIKHDLKLEMTYQSILAQLYLRMINIGKVFIVAFALVICLTSAINPNPCAFQLGGESVIPCAKRTPCAATFGRKRRAFCAWLPPGPGCICPKILKPVCCRIPLGMKATFTLTKDNSCICECFKGRVLFDGECDKPPSKPAACPRTFIPTCCYIRIFDLTITAANPCICEKRFGGVFAKPSICRIPPLR